MQSQRMDTLHDNHPSKLTGHRWAYILGRMFAPCAIGALGGQIQLGLANPLGALVPVSSFWIASVAALLAWRQPPSRAKSSAQRLRDVGWILLILATLLATAPFARTLMGQAREEQWARWWALGIGLGSMVSLTLSDWCDRTKGPKPYVLLAQPWLALLKLGLLASWLVATLSRPQQPFTASDQQLLSLVLLTEVGSLLLQRRSEPLARRLEQPSFSNPTYVSFLAGHLLPGLLLGLTITTGWIYAAFGAWPLLWLGEGLFYYHHDAQRGGFDEHPVTLR